MFGFLFPGQGTVRVGMGAWLRRRPVARDRLDEIDALLSRPISPLCARGPLDRLVSTEHAQVAVTACNLAALAVLAEEGYEPAVVAGHSVGELTALHAAGVLDLAETVRLVETRARLMAVAGGGGGMRAVMGLAVERVEELAAEAAAPGEPVVVGLENAPGHVVVSGAAPALDRLEKLATDATKIMPLKVGNAYHSPLMAAAVPPWAAAVAAPRCAPPRPRRAERHRRAHHRPPHAARGAGRPAHRQGPMDPYGRRGRRDRPRGRGRRQQGAGRAVPPGRGPLPEHGRPRHPAPPGQGGGRVNRWGSAAVGYAGLTRPVELLGGMRVADVYTAAERVRSTAGTLEHWAGRLAGKRAVLRLLGLPPTAGHLGQVEILPRPSPACRATPPVLTATRRPYT